MSGFVILFFVLTTVLLAINALSIGKAINTRAGEKFGQSLWFLAIGFLVWTYAVITKPSTGLDTIVSVGLLSYLVGTFLMVSAAVADWAQEKQRSILIFSGIYIIALLILRLLYPSAPAFSAEGLFFLNPHPLIKFFEIALFAMVMIPLALKLSNDLGKSRQLSGNVVIGSIVALLIGIILLLANTETTLLFLDGVVIDIALFALVGVSYRLYDNTKKN